MDDLGARYYAERFEAAGHTSTEKNHNFGDSINARTRPVPGQLVVPAIAAPMFLVCHDLVINACKADRPPAFPP